MPRKNATVANILCFVPNSLLPISKLTSPLPKIKKSNKRNIIFIPNIQNPDIIGKIAKIIPIIAYKMYPSFDNNGIHTIIANKPENSNNKPAIVVRGDKLLSFIYLVLFC